MDKELREIKEILELYLHYDCQDKVIEAVEIIDKLIEESKSKQDFELNGQDRY